MKKFFILSIAFIFIISLVLAGCQPAQTVPTQKPAEPTQKPAVKPITLKAITFQPGNSDASIRLKDYAARVKEMSGGELIMSYLGGGEVIPMQDQPEALRKGIVDIMATPITNYASLLPAAAGYYLTELSPMEERKSGFYDFFVEAHKAINMYYLGRSQCMAPAYIVTNKKVTTYSELAGQKIARSNKSSVPFLEGLGVTVVIMPEGDFYTAVEQRVVDGAMNPLDSMAELGLLKLVDYVIDIPLYRAARICTTMNLDSWNKLPAHLQKIVIDAMIAHEIKSYGEEGAILEKQKAQYTKERAKFITFSPEDTKRFKELSYEVEWKVLKEKVPAETYNRLLKVTRN
jgi:TRAP-type C4-dicarboxylate transport system substrate-binding protein